MEHLDSQTPGPVQYSPGLYPPPIPPLFPPSTPSIHRRGQGFNLWKNVTRQALGWGIWPHGRAKDEVQSQKTGALSDSWYIDW